MITAEAFLLRLLCCYAYIYAFTNSNSAALSCGNSLTGLIKEVFDSSFKKTAVNIPNLKNLKNFKYSV